MLDERTAELLGWLRAARQKEGEDALLLVAEVARGVPVEEDEERARGHETRIRSSSGVRTRASRGHEGAMVFVRERDKGAMSSHDSRQPGLLTTPAFSATIDCAARAAASASTRAQWASPRKAIAP